MKRLFCLLITLSMLLGVCACDGAPIEGVVYTITFDTDGGSAVNPIAKTADSDLAAPVAPTKDGYVFEGWYKDKACTQVFAFGVMPAENLTLYAKWRYVGSDTPSGTTPGGTTPGGTTPGGTTPGGDRNENESWEGVDFNGQTVRLCVSEHQPPDNYFPAADIYTKGPDTAGSNEVAKEVLARNARVAEELNIAVVYETRNLYYDAVIEDVRCIAMGGSKNSPDIYNNDLRSLTYSMLSGYLWNVKDPGEGVWGYFDFTADGWYEEYIKGCTFDQEKLYIFAGDYFIDMIRMAWVIYVNEDILEANIAKLPYDDLDDFYGDVEAGYWDIDDLADMSNAVFADGESGMYGVTEKTDSVVGLAYAATSQWAFSAASGITLYYQDKEDGYKPKVLQDITDFGKVANKFQELQATQGVYFQQETRSTSECFLQGNFLFAVSFLGEMASEEYRCFLGNKGLVPIPKWNVSAQADYHTPVYDQAELGCILNTARAFTVSTALMQRLIEESDQVVHAYYEKGMKYKYNSSRNARVMMDIVRETIDSPFGLWIGDHCQSLYTGTGKLKGMYITDKSLFSTFASEKDAYNDCMAKMIEHFKTLP